MANVITGFRAACSIALLFCPVLSPAFYAVYLAAGLSDVFDGQVARKTNTASEFGSRLDTAADFVFVIVCLVKLLPAMSLPVWLYAWIGVIAVIKTVNLVSGLVCHRKLVAVHTVMNKVTGALLFALPLTFPLMQATIPAAVVCAVAAFAAVQEGYLIRTGKASASDSGKRPVTDKTPG